MARKTTSARAAKATSAGRKPLTARSGVSRQRPTFTRSGEQTSHAGISSAAVEKATGRPWSHWLAVLDRAGAKDRPHKDIAEVLRLGHGITPWWSQMITVGYEQARGLRVKHQTSRGFTANASRTIAATAIAITKEFTNTRARTKWLPDAPVSIRKATPGESIRLNWTDPPTRKCSEPRQCIIEVNLVDKSAPGKHKTAVQVQEGRLASTSEVAKRKAYWAAALDRLRSQLEA